MKLYKCLQVNLRRIRKNQNLTQALVAEKAAIDYKDYQRLETGNEENPTLKTLERLAHALGVDASELLKRPKT